MSFVHDAFLPQKMTNFNKSEFNLLADMIALRFFFLVTIQTSCIYVYIHTHLYKYI